MKALCRLWRVIWCRHRWSANGRIAGGRETFFRYRCYLCQAESIRRGL